MTNNNDDDDDDNNQQTLYKIKALLALYIYIYILKGSAQSKFYFKFQQYIWCDKR
jgi:hypothetical protein